jgi:hypothetical protein
MMEAARTSETLVNFYQTTRCYNPYSALRTSNPTKNYTVLVGTAEGKRPLGRARRKREHILYYFKIDKEIVYYMTV